jgi:hypothetical protein
LNVEARHESSLADIAYLIFDLQFHIYPEQPSFTESYAALAFAVGKPAKYK